MYKKKNREIIIGSNNAGKIKETKMLKRRSKRYGINIHEELGRNFREKEPVVSHEEEGF